MRKTFVVCVQNITFSASRELLTGLRSRGFRLSRGIKDTGYFLLGLEKLGGYYIGNCLRFRYHPVIFKIWF